MRQGRRLSPTWLWAVLVLTIVGVLGRAAWTARATHRTAGGPSTAQIRATLAQALRQGPPQLPVYGEVPVFALTDHRGRPFTRGDLAGQVWIVDFIFTRCAGQCVMMTAQMASLQERLPKEIRQLSVSVDPAHDTPEKLAGYAARAGARSERWLFVTGSEDAVFQLSREGFHLGVAAEGGTPAEPIIHSVRLVLVDQEGRIRGYYDATDAAAVDRLLMEATTLLRNTPEEVR